MERFIIKTIIRGQKEVTYHEKIELTTRKDVMNVYVQSVTKDKKKALRFYDREEAEKMAKFVEESWLKAKVIKG